MLDVVNDSVEMRFCNLIDINDQCQVRRLLFGKLHLTQGSILDC